MLSLLITNNSVSNPQTLDLSPFVDVQDGSGLDIANPAFTNRVYSRSLLKEGASLALTQYVEKQLVFPLLIGPVGGYSQSPTTFGQMATLIEQVNQLLDTPGAVISWMADQASQPTFFDVIAGQFEVAYSYRKEQQDWTMGNLRVFCQPFGRTAGPRPFAAASAVGPLLMISPYASGGAQAIQLGAPNESWISGANGPRGVAVDSAHVYWANNGGNAIARANIDGSSPSQSWISGASGPQGVAVDTFHTFWTNQTANAIGRSNLDGSSPSQTFITGASGPQGIAVSAGVVYWANNTTNAIARANTDGSLPSQTWITATGARGVAVDSSHVYWCNSTGNAIARANIDGSSPARFAGASSPQYIAVDSSYVYWTNDIAPYAIGRANLDGSSPSQTWITGASDPRGIAVDSTYAYWANNTPNTIARANLAGYGGQQQGPSSGVFYNGLPSLAGDAQALLQISYDGPQTAAPVMAVAVLPDKSYQPLITAAMFSGGNAVTSAAGIASAYRSFPAQGLSALSFSWTTGPYASAPPVAWAGGHRILAIARASSAVANPFATLSSIPDLVSVGVSTIASVPALTDWALYDLGTYGLRASETNQIAPTFAINAPSATVDIAGFVSLPDQNSWFMNATQASSANAQLYGWTNVLLDDPRGDQFTYSTNFAGAPSPAYLAAQPAIRITPFTRGLVPRPDPKNGLPIIAIVGVGASHVVGVASNPVNILQTANVSVLERVKYQLP